MFSFEKIVLSITKNRNMRRKFIPVLSWMLALGMEMR